MGRTLHDGRHDGLIPLESLALAEVRSFGDLLKAMGRTAFSGRQLGEAFEIVLEMVRDPSCQVVATVSGAMTVAKQGRILCDMIDRGMVQAVVATGALIAHGLTESIGLVHYRYDPSHDDDALYQRGYNRIYDTLEMEANLNDVMEWIWSVLDETAPEDAEWSAPSANGADSAGASEQPGETVASAWSSARLCRALGRRLSEQQRGPGILRSAYERRVPVFIPAFTDSEMGLDVSAWAMLRAAQNEGRDPAILTQEELLAAVPPFNPFLDLQEYARLAGGAERLGVFTIGGGVPRNWAQQVAPYIDVTNQRLGSRLKPPRFQYGVRICPEPVHWGGLSGCTYSEGVSWGKFVPASEGGRFAEVYADATIAWPLLMKGVFEELDRAL